VVAARIIVAAVLAAVLYGVVHDQFTARISIEYFTVGHPRLFQSDAPALHAAAWGVLATWWMGAVLGVALASCARAGRPPRLSLRRVLPLVAGVMAFAAAAATGAGLAAWILAARGAISLPPEWADLVSPAQREGFLVDTWIHTASYVGGAVGGVVACALALRMRRKAPGPA
jgi:hypothetical protein